MAVGGGEREQWSMQLLELRQKQLWMEPRTQCLSDESLGKADRGEVS
jgi:hypothetical protein